MTRKNRRFFKRADASEIISGERSGDRLDRAPHSHASAPCDRRGSQLGARLVERFIVSPRATARWLASDHESPPVRGAATGNLASTLALKMGPDQKTQCGRQKSIRMKRIYQCRAPRSASLFAPIVPRTAALGTGCQTSNSTTRCSCHESVAASASSSAFTPS
jgi:hypothetical protein